ncbi:helix-turn-helix transcriptional regulator [Aquimarina sp. 2201CG14-23]|nr:helix-turn-helix transcriptional regulator [Aquimarina sp. 2201CG14-23]MDH7445782.1 helix-turn-helix transcriptional regulator [Aquimarina sp. 2201CG14-23]
MKFYHVSASGFADAMGVGRSSISHILSGRNKPSLDFVMKITEAYPEAELYWLLYGKGTFPKSEKPTSIDQIKPQTLTPPSTPTKITEQITSKQDLFSPQTSTSKPDINTTPEAEKPVRQVLSTTKEISQIVIFYIDGTFDVFKN